MGVITEEIVQGVLRDVVDPSNGQDIVSQGMVLSVRISPNNDVMVMLSVSPERGPQLEVVRQNTETALRALPNVGRVMCGMTAERGQSLIPDIARRSVAAQGKMPVAARKVILVASGKGGVGKSTVSANLAAWLSNFGRIKRARNGEAEEALKVGLLDADIYGPSIPKMLGQEGFKPALDPKKKIEPLRVYNMQAMSVGFLTNDDSALVWRGPMVQKALIQMLRDVAWGGAGDKSRDGEPLDYLIVDLPPGTGDIQITLAQRFDVAGAVVVSTPQDIALIDARKAVQMFQKMDVPVLGLVENMGTYICPNCGHEGHIFGVDGGRKEAERLGIPFLGTVPLASDIRLNADEGKPIVLAQPDSLPAQMFGRIAEKILAVCS